MHDRFSIVSKFSGLTISLGKTEVHYQPAANTHPARGITRDSTQSANVYDVKYLSRTTSHDGCMGKKDARKKKLRKPGTQETPYRNVRSTHHTPANESKKMYCAMIHPFLLCGCETWTFYRGHIKKLETFHLRVLRSILGITWQDRINIIIIINLLTASIVSGE